MIEQVTKKQHYIPQLLLRNFAIEIRSCYRINVYDIQRNIMRSNQNIEDVCAQNWLYDKDNVVENILSRKIEAPASIEITKLLTEPHKIEDSPKMEILRFITVLMSRTVEASKQALEFLNSFTGTMFKEILRLNGFDEADGEKLRLVPKEPRNISAFIAIDAIYNWPLIHDLGVRLLINRTDSEFIISDHPVFFYNWYLRDSKELSVSSLTSKGLQIFLPISPHLTYCLYDKQIYKYGIKNISYINIDQNQDVAILNSFQALNSSSFLLYHSGIMSNQVTQLANKYHDKDTFSCKAAYSPAAIDEKGQLKSIHIV